MKKLLFILLLSPSLFAQNVPLIKVGEKKLGIQKLKIDVEVIGNRIQKTYDMYFYNPTSEILEGELMFPLGENQSVSRFALEVNGNLREAVVVEREQGRIAFEAVVRRRVDPALLEKVAGNNYKARIYPIPAKGYKRVVITIDQEFPHTSDINSFAINQDFDHELEEYEVRVTFKGFKAEPIINQESNYYTFTKIGDDFSFHLLKKKFKPSDELIFTVNSNPDFQPYLYDDYLYAFKHLEAVMTPRKISKKVSIAWDHSFSMESRDIEKELKFLESYLKKSNPESVHLVMFSNKVDYSRIFDFPADWDEMKGLLSNTPNDGATTFEGLDGYLRNAGEVLIFSDGIQSLNTLIPDIKVPIFAINSILSGAHDVLSNIGATSNGGYINLVELSNDEAIERITTNPMKLMSVSSNNSNMEIFPLAGTVVTKNMSLFAKGVKPNDRITLTFGDGNQIFQQANIIVPEKFNGSDRIAKLFAKAKIDHLQNNGELHKSEVIDLSKEYQVISNYTSLIVLELITDYIRYKIEPPADMREEYEAYMKGRKELTQTVITENDVEEEDLQEENETIESIEIEPAVVGSFVTISGVILDENNMPLPGVNIIEVNTSNGTQTDFDGKYQITVTAGGTLVYSYVGYQTMEYDITGGGNVNFSMESDSSALNEVVVTGYSVSRERKALSYSVSTINSEEISRPEYNSIDNLLSGKAAGVQVGRLNSMVGASSQIVIRGIASYNQNNNALIVVDGVPMNRGVTGQGSFLDDAMGPSRDFDIDTNNIESVQILKGFAATTIYGSEGRNGVILITTKTAAEGNRARNAYNYQNQERNVFKESESRFQRSLSHMIIHDESFIPTLNYIDSEEVLDTPNKIYSYYLKKREIHRGLPGFYIAIAQKMRNYDVFLADRILSNLIEIDPDNYEFLKIYAYKLEEQSQFDIAVNVYRKILELRPEDVQSYRDLGLALKEIGSFEEAFNILNTIATDKIYKNNDRRQFGGLKDIVVNEMRNIVHNNGIPFDIENTPNQVVVNYEMDLRVVIDWNHNDTDIDLHVVDPNYDECYYSQPKNRTGGHLSRDMTQGFGPEEFCQRYTKGGSYYLIVNYYGDRYQKIDTPTYLKLTVYRNYGRPTQTREIKVFELSGKRKKHVLDKIIF